MKRPTSVTSTADTLLNARLLAAGTTSGTARATALDGFLCLVEESRHYCDGGCGSCWLDVYFGLMCFRQNWDYSEHFPSTYIHPPSSKNVISSSRFDILSGLPTIALFLPSLQKAGRVVRKSCEADDLEPQRLRAASSQARGHDMHWWDMTMSGPHCSSIG